MKKIGTLAVFLLVFFSSCAPFTKDAYLNRYMKFMEKVSSEYRVYDEKKWAKSDKKFEKLNNKWYERFKDELSVKEKILISGYKIKYSSLKAISSFNKKLQSVIKDDLDIIIEKIDRYVEEIMDDDLYQMLQDVRNISRQFFD